MNPVLEVLARRKSIRAYKDQPVSEQDKEAILQAAMRSPTAGNMMLYTILEIEDQVIKDRLAVTCDNQPFIARAPYLLLFLADYQRWFDYYLASGVEDLCSERGKTIRYPGAGDLMLACCDALIAAQTAVIAAESLGIGSCYIGDILEQFEVHRQLFNLPRYVIPVTLICFGFPAPEQAARQQPKRFDPEFIVHKNTYEHQDSHNLERMMHDQNAHLLKHPRKDGLLNEGQLNYFQKFSADFSIEMNRSVAEMVKSWSEKPD